MEVSEENVVSWLVWGTFVSYIKDKERASSILDRHFGTLGSGNLTIVDGSIVLTERLGSVKKEK